MYQDHKNRRDEPRKERHDHGAPFSQRYIASTNTAMSPLIAMVVLTCLRGALPPVLLRAVCLVRAMVSCSADG